MRYKLLLPIVVTIVIFIVIFTQIDIASFANRMLAVNLLMFVVAMTFTAFTVILNGIRWKYLIGRYHNLSIRKSIKLTLLGFSFNFVAPSRLGDFTKAHYLKKDNVMNFSTGSSSIVFEKGLDILCLSLLSVIGVLALSLSNLYILVLIPVLLIVFFFMVGHLKKIGLLMRRERLGNVITNFCNFFEEVKSNRRLFLFALGMTFLLWAVSIIQVYLFFLSFGAVPDMLSLFGLVPIAIIAGMIPITIAGMGTRESAMILLFPAMSEPLVLGVGFFMTLRYVLAALAGLPATREYLQKL
jgi:uncharacterized protein (TIRG00374 family)